MAIKFSIAFKEQLMDRYRHRDEGDANTTKDVEVELSVLTPD
jgi:hypothetical protein